MLDFLAEIEYSLYKGISCNTWRFVAILIPQQDCALWHLACSSLSICYSPHLLKVQQDQTRVSRKLISHSDCHHPCITAYNAHTMYSNRILSCDAQVFFLSHLSVGWISHIGAGWKVFLVLCTFFITMGTGNSAKNVTSSHVTLLILWCCSLLHHSLRFHHRWRK